MTEIPLYDADEDAPAPRPRAEVRFAEVNVRPHADGRRVRLNLRITPFLERPSLEAWVTNPDGAVVSSMNLIEAMDTDLEFTLHLRGPEPRGTHTLRLSLFYPENDDAPVEQRQVVAEESVSFEPASPA